MQTRVQLIFNFDTDWYQGKFETEEQVKELFRAMFRGEADFPSGEMEVDFLGIESPKAGLVTTQEKKAGDLTFHRL